ncbi:AraC family transcriptional regulator [Leifsonia sp. NPDC080035]|uniref:AraC family transcriptional regulator n=1 Tax=Leifsonia sp. NPDC080035 TaxID=3143936 RepID=A0AAU7G7K2_9MICO
MDDLRRVRSRTNDPAEADALLREANGRFAFSRDPGADFTFDVKQDGDDELSVGLYRIGGRWESDGEFDQFSLSAVFSGDYAWEIDGDRDSSYRMPFLSRPGHDLFGHGRDLSIVNIYISAEKLGEVARVVYADDAIVPEFASPRPVSPDKGRWAQQVAQVAAEFVRSGTIDNSMVRAGLFHTVALAVLECFPLTGQREDRPTTAQGQRQVHRRAMRFVDDNLSLPITPADLAAAAGTSLFGLDAAFRAHTGSSSGAYLRQARLSAAHADRMRGPVETDAVVAARWGFASADRFRRAYDAVYGPEEPPAA